MYLIYLLFVGYNSFMKYDLKTNNTIAYNCHYHVVFCPKYRRKVLVNGVDERLKTILIETIEKWGQELVELEVMPDHVHLLVGCDPQFGIHRLVKYLKGTSSRYLRQEFPQLKRRLPSLWTNSYFVATTGGVTLETLKRYVEGQKNR
jgi:putative transposase